MKTNVERLCECLEFLIENSETAEERSNRQTKRGETMSVEHKKRYEQFKNCSQSAISLQNCSDVQQAIERMPDWETRAHDFREVIEELREWKPVQTNRSKAILKEFLAELKSGPDPSAYVNDPIIKARIELLERLTIDEVNDTISFDNHSYSVSYDVAKLFMLIRQEFPRLVVVSQHEIRLDRLKLPPELDRLLDRVGKNGVSIKLPKDCQNSA